MDTQVILDHMKIWTDVALSSIGGVEFLRLRRCFDGSDLLVAILACWPAHARRPSYSSTCPFSTPAEPRGRMGRLQAAPPKALV